MSKIPSHAKRVFKGVIYDVYQWEQELFDGSKATFECLKRPNTVIVIPIAGNTVFYARQEQPNKPPFLSLFGGTAEDKEAPIETAKRELFEETGFQSNNWKQFKKHSFPSGKISWDIYYFLAFDCQKTGEQELDAGEKIEIRQASMDEFLTKIVPDENFSEYELRNEVMSAFNKDRVSEFKKILQGK